MICATQPVHSPELGGEGGDMGRANTAASLRVPVDYPCQLWAACWLSHGCAGPYRSVHVGSSCARLRLLQPEPRLSREAVV